MFRFGKKKTGIAVSAPVTGTLVALADIPDPVFSKGAVGNGFAVSPQDGTVVAPVSGELVMVFPTSHAFAVKTQEGAEVLVHVGVDTVSLKGEGFSTIKTKGEHVEAGEPVVGFDLALADDPRVVSVDVIVVVTNSAKFEFGEMLPAGTSVSPGDDIVKLHPLSS